MRTVASLRNSTRAYSASDRPFARILATRVAILVGLFLADSTLQGIGGATYGVLAAVVALGAVPVSVAVALLRR